MYCLRIWSVMPVLLALLMPAVTALACDIYVDRLDDPGTGGDACTAAAGDCSLRGALAAASGDQTICFESDGVYEVGAELLLDKNLTVNGTGEDVLFVQPEVSMDIRVFHVAQGVTAVIQNLTIRNGVSDNAERGGGLLNEGEATLNNVTVRDCTMLGAWSGAGMYHNGTLLTMNSCLVKDNIGHSGGGLSAKAPVVLNECRFENNQATGNTGGAIDLDDTGSTMNFVATNSVFTGNEANFNGGAISGSNLDNSCSLTLNNCEFSDNVSNMTGGAVSARYTVFKATNTTFSGNQAAAYGGAIRLSEPAGGSHLSFCTITNNTSDSVGDDVGDGAVYIYMDYMSASLDFKGNVLAGNIDNTTPPASVVPDISVDSQYSSNVNSLGGNFLNVYGDGSDLATAKFPVGNPNVNGDYVGSHYNAATLDPKLLALADNGGPTRTHALAPGSPLLNKGPAPCTDAEDNPVNTDQRGGERPLGAAADIGAYEGHAGLLIAPIMLTLP